MATKKNTKKRVAELGIEPIETKFARHLVASEPDPYGYSPTSPHDDAPQSPHYSPQSPHYSPQSPRDSFNEKEEDNAELELSIARLEMILETFKDSDFFFLKTMRPSGTSLFPTREAKRNLYSTLTNTTWTHPNYTEGTFSFTARAAAALVALIEKGVRFFNEAYLDYYGCGVEGGVHPETLRLLESLGFTLILDA